MSFFTHKKDSGGASILRIDESFPLKSSLCIYIVHVVCTYEFQINVQHFYLIIFALFWEGILSSMSNLEHTCMYSILYYNKKRLLNNLHIYVSILKQKFPSTSSCTKNVSYHMAPFHEFFLTFFINARMIIKFKKFLVKTLFLKLGTFEVGNIT